MARPKYNQIYREIKEAFYRRFPVCEAYLDDDFAIGDILVKYRYVENLEDFYDKLRKGYFQISRATIPLKFERLKGLDDITCLRKRVFWSSNNFSKGFAILKMGDSQDNLILLHIRRLSGRV